MLKFHRLSYIKKKEDGSQDYCVIGALCAASGLNVGLLSKYNGRTFNTLAWRGSEMQMLVRDLVIHTLLGVERLQELQELNDRREWEMLERKLKEWNLHEKVKPYALKKKN